MNGAVLGDIIGSVYEFHTIKQKEFKLLKPKCFFTDDSVLTCAVAKASLSYLEDHSVDNFRRNVTRELKEFGKKYPDAGYGYSFDSWVHSEDTEPYGSYGNGGAMRTSPVAYVAESLDEAIELAGVQASTTHNHPEGVKGAQAITACIYLACNHASKEEIRKYVVEHFYPLDFTIPSIYRKYQYDITAQGSVPQAIESFLEGNDFEDCVRNAVSLGGDADTLAAMTGSIAEAFYGVPKELEEQISVYLDPDLNAVREEFYQKTQKKTDSLEEKHVVM